VGLTEGSTGQYFFSLDLQAAEMSISNFEVINFPPSELPLALQRGLVDAICTWEPHAINAKRLLGGNARALNTPDNLYREDFYFVASKQMLNESSDVLKRFSCAILEPENFINRCDKTDKAITTRRPNRDPALQESW